jgi:hypothetical protein
MQGMSDQPRARIQCAAITRGCMSFLIFEVPPGFNLDNLDADTGPGRILGMNGWHRDHGRWVCAAHKRKPCEHQDSRGRLVAPYI